MRKTSNFDEAFKNPEVKRVAIAAPAGLHYNLAKAALMAGKDVFVGKPLCLNVAEGEELVEIADRQGLVLMVGHLLQYHPCIEKIHPLSRPFGTRPIIVLFHPALKRRAILGMSLRDKSRSM